MSAISEDKCPRIDIDLLRDGIFSMLAQHPDISEFDGGQSAHTTHLNRFVCKNGERIGHEADRDKQQNIWVHRDAVRFHPFIGYAFEFKASKHNHHLYASGFFNEGDQLVCFYPRDLWEAARIIREVAGDREAGT